MNKVSLILTTYNCAANLKTTLRSIENQNYSNMEIVIKDGMSTDETLNIIKQYQSSSKHEVLWKSERDEGIFDAMNRGYRMCSGDIIAVFNERFLMPDAVSQLVRAMENETGQYVGAHCDLDYMDGAKVVRKWRMGDGKIKNGWLPGHPTLFLRREIYEKYGLYNTKYKISADYEFMMRFLKDEENRLAYVSKVLVGMYYGGTSTSSLNSYVQSLKEGHQALKENGYDHAWLIDLKRTLRVGGQFIRR